jgi:hypothetical protein
MDPMLKLLREFINQYGFAVQALVLASHWLEDFADGTPTAVKTY